MGDLFLTSKYNYNGKIKIDKKPTKKYMKLHGKTVYDKDANNFKKSVWKKKIIKPNQYHEKIVVYVMYKCDKDGCDGNLEYDQRGYKICNKCGLGLKDTVLFDNGYKYRKYSNGGWYSNRNYFDGWTKNSQSDETIKLRNIKSDTLDMNEFMNFKDDGAKEIILRCERIKAWEKEHDINGK